MRLPQTKTMLEVIEDSTNGGVQSLIEAQDVQTATLVESLKGTVSDAIRSAVTEYLTETWTYIKADLVNTSYIIVLIGGTICVILYVAGWDKGMKYLGIAFVGHLLLRAILG